MGDRLDSLLGLSDEGASSDVGAPGHESAERPRRDGRPHAEPPLGSLISVAIDMIEPNPFQPRARFEESDLDALAESIAELGVLQPVLLRRIDNDRSGGETDRYELIAGERRWRAARRAGLDTVPAIVRPADDRGSLERAVVENLHRADLNPLEEAAAYRQLIDDFSMTQEAVAQRVGKSRSAVANLLRLFSLPSGVQRLIASGQLGAGHARALLSFADRRWQEVTAARVVRDGLSVRAVEELVRQATERADDDERAGERSGPVKAAALLEIEAELGDRLATRVEVAVTKDRGRLVVEFADLADLDRIYRLLS